MRQVLLTIDPAVQERIQTSLREARQARLVFHHACRDFRYFLGHWQFRSRETGALLQFTEEHLWAGQEIFVEAAVESPWMFALKAGKLGFSELECAFDVWRALSQPAARVHIFSKDQLASFDLLQYVRFGLTHLPGAWGVRVLSDVAGGDSSRSLKFISSLWPSDDARTIVSYPATKTVAIDQSCIHSHVDELAHMPYPAETWNAVASTVAPAGTLHVVTRGAGEGFAADLFRDAVRGRAGGLRPLFADWMQRPGRTPQWRAEQEGRMTTAGVAHYAPEDFEDALRGDQTEMFTRPEWWDACYDPTLPPLLPGDRTPLVLACDAGISSDTFAIVGCSRHPVRHDEPAVRLVKLFDPRHSHGVVDLDECERYIRILCGGACRNGHPRSLPEPDCFDCKAETPAIARFNVVQLTVDIYQLASMTQRLRADGVVWVDEFSQQNDRLKSDRALYDAIVGRRVSHNGDPILRQHVLNAAIKPARDDSTLRIVKQSHAKKVDAAVALSMSAQRVTYLIL